ncbi:MAG TPA: hypothetical protein VFC63_04550 [Blastocatellia bacterium]|nr:hypothetical protein [Blastocatellia bacterium]
MDCKKWTIILGPSDEVQPEDIPEDINLLLPGIRYLTEINLSPINFSWLARRSINRVAKSVAKAAHGVIFDPQEGSITTPSGVKRYESRRREQRFSILEMNWLFTDGPLLEKNGPEIFVKFLETRLPESMPRRYGEYEPVQHLYAKTGRDHFLQFLCDNNWSIVWYPTRPVLHVNVTSYGKNWGPTSRGFRANKVSLAIEASAINQPGWETAIKDIWYKLSELITPFYGDVKILDGYVSSGATYSLARDTERSSSSDPWWKGIPLTLGLAAVIGEPYLSLWPEFRHAATIDKGLAFLTLDDWTRKGDISTRIGGVPEVLARHGHWEEKRISDRGVLRDYVVEYPKIWPFEGPFSDQRPR